MNTDYVSFISDLVDKVEKEKKSEELICIIVDPLGYDMISTYKERAGLKKDERYATDTFMDYMIVVVNMNISTHFVIGYTTHHKI